MKSDSYQRHIDGLRAVAVLSVLAYHLGLPYSRGGYVGVDVFFVISGFLITRLIANELIETGQFSFKRFYVRRVRRLFPALLATLSTSFIAGFFLFSPPTFQNFSKELVAAILSFSNFLFWSQAGYFDTAAELKPLLHTWSLSVEEQFYLLWPMTLVFLMRRFSRKVCWGLVVLGGGLSLLANHPFASGTTGWLNAMVPQAAEWFSDSRATIFYLTPFRVFEFAIGAVLVALAPRMPGSRLLHEGLMLGGLALVLYAIVSFTDRILFPYYNALVPCLGAAFVILADRSSIAGVVVRNRLAVGVGLISYSLYLVHWPLIVFYKYYTFAPLGNAEKAAIAVAAITLATLMYYHVETPFRRPRGVVPQPGMSGNRRFITTCLGLAAGTCVIAATVWSTEGWAWRNPEALTPSEIKAGMGRRFSLTQKACSIAELDNPAKCDLQRPLQVLFIGNSHEPDAFNAFHEMYGSSPGVNLITFNTLNLCEVKMTAGGPVSSKTLRKCDLRVARLRDRVFLNNLDIVVYSANMPFLNFQIYLWNLLDYFKQANPGIRLIVFGGYLNQTRDCTELFNRFGSFDACRKKKYTSYRDMQERQHSKLELARTLDYLYIDNFKLLCPSGRLRSCAVFAGGEPVTYDRHHRSLGFARYNGTLISRAYGKQLTGVGFPPVATAGD